MEITGKTIRRKNHGCGFIKDQVDAILGDIETNIEQAHEQRKPFVIVELPQTFDIPHMKTIDAQRMIYFKILRELDRRDFEAKIYFPPRYCKQCGKNRSEQNLVIHKTLKKRIVCKFCGRLTKILPNSKICIKIMLETEDDIEIKKEMDRYINSKRGSS